MAVKLMGEIITWAAGRSGITVAMKEVVAALKANGLDEKVAKPINPRAAFMRSVAMKDVAEDRLVRVVKEDENSVTFQLTAESLGKDETLGYAYDTKVTLDKSTGMVQGPSKEVVAKAQAYIDKRQKLFNAVDIANMIQKLFKAQADLFSVRDQGGVYFVPSVHSTFVDSVQKFYESIGGKVNRFPVPEGIDHSRKSVKATIDAGMQEMVDELTAGIEKLDADSRPATVERYATRIKTLQFKVESYAIYLEEKKSGLNASLKAAKKQLAQKLSDMSEQAAKE